MTTHHSRYLSSPTPSEQRRLPSPNAITAHGPRYLASPSPPHGGRYVGAAPPRVATSSRTRIREDDVVQKFFIECKHLPFLYLPLIQTYI